MLFVVCCLLFVDVVGGAVIIGGIADVDLGAVVVVDVVVAVVVVVDVVDVVDVVVVVVVVVYVYVV